MEPNLLGLLLPEPTARDNKYSRGTVGLVTGSDDYPGAALLGIAGAQGTSVGFVRYVGPRRVSDLVLLSHPEVVVCDSTESAGPAQAWVLGSGIGVQRGVIQGQVQNLKAAFASATVAVIDAAALDLVGETATPTYAHYLLTPHQGEICRLLNRLDSGSFIHPEKLDDRELAVEATLKAARLSGHAVLLKGAITTIAQPDGRFIEVGPNSSRLATAGTGDVLAGIIGGIAAQNPLVAQANWLDIARLAVELHSAAAEIANQQGTVTASTVASAVSQAISRRFHR